MLTGAQSIDFTTDILQTTSLWVLTKSKLMDAQSIDFTMDILRKASLWLLKVMISPWTSVKKQAYG
jgi:hypothetical protein